MSFDRRTFLSAVVVGLGASLVPRTGPAGGTAAFQLATFVAEVTPPIGHPLLGGLRGPAVKITDPLSARGIVLVTGGEPLVIAAVDWCELRNDAYDSFRDSLASAAGTSRERVLLSCLHQHDAPYFDLTAQKLLDKTGLVSVMFDPAFFDRAIRDVAAAAKDALTRPQSFTHLGVGEAAVQGVACNRRVVGADGKPRFNRYSFARDSAVRDAPDGEIDPLLKTLSFWNGDKALAAISVYATHPMSYYGNGEVSYDFPGMARELRQREMPEVFQIYVTGCSGDVVAAKYNDGTPTGRQALAEQLLAGMRDAWKQTRKVAATKMQFRCAKLDLSPPDEGTLTIEAMQTTLANREASNSDRIHAAMGLSYRRRADSGQLIDVPAIDFGPAQYVVLPAELFVNYQLAAQKMRPDQMILTAGFGECAPGYIPTDQARREGFVQEHGYCWVKPDVEQSIKSAIAEALGEERR